MTVALHSAFWLVPGEIAAILVDILFMYNHAPIYNVIHTSPVQSLSGSSSTIFGFSLPKTVYVYFSQKIHLTVAFLNLKIWNLSKNHHPNFHHMASLVYFTWRNLKLTLLWSTMFRSWTLSLDPLGTCSLFWPYQT